MGNDGSKQEETGEIHNGHIFLEDGGAVFQALSLEEEDAAAVVNGHPLYYSMRRTAKRDTKVWQLPFKKQLVRLSIIVYH